MARRKIIAALVLLAAGAAYAWLTTLLPERTLPNTPGPWFFPSLIAGALLALSAALLVQGLRGAAGDAPAEPGAGRRAVGLAWFVAYLAALPAVGFVVASVPFFAGLMALYGARRPLWIAIGSLGLPIGLFYLFRDVFQILLPGGAWTALTG